MIAVVVKAEQPEFFGILRTIFHAWGEPGVDMDLDKPPPAWALVERFDLDDAFWRMAKTSFGYEDADPSLKKLLLSLLVTDFAYNAKGECPQALKGLLRPEARGGRTPSYAWRNGATAAASPTATTACPRPSRRS